MNTARRIAWLFLAWAMATFAKGEAAASFASDEIRPANGATRPNGLPALGGELVPDSGQLPTGQLGLAAEFAGELTGELHFRVGEWAVSGPFCLKLRMGETERVGETGLPLLLLVSFRADELPLLELELSDLAVEAEVDLARNVARVSVAELTAFGGRVSLRPFEIDLGNAEAISVEAIGELHGLALDQLAAFVPEAVREASGRVSGAVRLSWGAASGLQVGSGALRIDADAEDAQLRLAAMPGFLTQHTTPRFVWMPASLGRLARWLALDNPAYDTLAEIEEGTQPLHIEALHVSLYPDGLGGPRSAAVNLVARPVSGAVVKQLRFDINVSGPLDQVLQIGASDTVRLNFGGK